MIRHRKVNFDHLDEKTLELKSILEAYKDKVVVVYLFGSCHSGKITPLSDIDIAVLFDESLNKEEIETMESQIYIKLTKVFGTDEVDLIVLNRAPLSIKFGVLRDKEIIYYSNKEKVVDFQCGVISEYMDFKPVRDELNRDFLLAMKGGRQING